MDMMGVMLNTFGEKWEDVIANGMEGNDE